MRLALAVVALAAAAGAAGAQPVDLDEMDANGDGKLTRTEYRAGLIAGSMKFDRDGDGRIFPSEMPAAARLPGIKPVMMRVFRQNDTSGDGALSREELGARAEARFTEIDANGDGFLERAEIKAARKRR